MTFHRLLPFSNPPSVREAAATAEDANDVEEPTPRGPMRSSNPPRTRSIVGHVVLSVETGRPVEFLDVTDAISRAIRDVALIEGVVIIHSRHTTTGVMINEHEPLLLQDLEAMFERVVPASAGYAHDDFSRRTINFAPGERRNGHAHLRAALLRTSETLSVVRGRLDLGKWQRVFLVELDGGQRRELALTMLGAGGVRDA